MIKNKVNVDEQVQRMKTLMNYGLVENKQPIYSDVEYSKVAADGKLYGIVREGAKYYIKVAKSADCNIVAESFDYIGGFRNRKENMFESFASAQRYFDEKMIAINESIDDKQKRVIAESWDINAKKDVIEEGTRKMQAEIARQKEIMKNAQAINETKKCDMEGGCPKCDTMKVEEPKSVPGAPFTETLKNSDLKDNEKTNIKGKKKPVVGNKKATNESTQVPLSSKENPDYMDTSKGTEKGDNAPFTDNVDNDEVEVVEVEETEAVNEEVVINSPDNQNKPSVGTGEVGDADPYDEDVNINESEEDDFDFDETDEVNIEGDEDNVDDVEASEVAVDDEIEDNGEDEVEDDVVETPEVDSTEARLDALETKLDEILNAINSMKYDDDETLYDDSNETDDSEDVETDAEEDLDNEDDFDDDDEYEVVESKSYKEYKKRQLKEENYFGKHPAYQKKVMTTPQINMPEKEGQYDMNDKSTEGEKPFGTEKGNQKPFEIDVEKMEEEITESVMKMLKKKLR